MIDPSVHTDDTRFLELLERWLTGEFTRSDERELHALTETDAFRQEAWEGFAALPGDQHEVQLDRLRQRLLGRAGGSRIPIGMWMAAAAILLLVVAVVYFFPNVQKPPAVSPAAQSTNPERMPDSAIVAREPKAAGQPQSAQGVATADNEWTASESAHAEETSSPPVRIFEGLQPKPDLPDPVTVGGPDKFLQNAPLNPTPGGPAANYKPDNAPATDVTRQSEKAKADERAKDSTAAQPAASDKKESAAAETAPSGVPAGGWDNFHLYLRRNARLPDAARNNNISGKVRLQFTIGPDGKPANVLVIQPLRFGCDEEAMRLIREFDWSPAGAGPVIVDVPFVR
ncbi:MAG: TonB family protein [Saprospirales bacterium]|nr:TonB family protein [Saprospirales bacterium]